MLTSSLSQQIINRLYSIHVDLSDEDFAQESVEIINQKIGADLVGIWLFSENMQFAILQAGSGNMGRRLVANRHKIPLNTSNDLLAPVAEGEIRVIDGWSGEIYNCKPPKTIGFDSNLPMFLIKKFEVMHSKNPIQHINVTLPDPRWEIAIPLRTKTQIYGALYIQILEFSKFTLEYCSKWQWLADQLCSIYMEEN